ncbi:hypothetical protein AB0F17_64945 [Nonomuraea sp. NPDC026600]|uniref:hypothetical protein n=1 Tax=Nonomuraea sp. NPDC026600 TaxID=3155363 RepID=UPI00340D24DC
METVIDSRLDALRAELERFGWIAQHHGRGGGVPRPFLHVLNPLDRGLNDSVECRAERFCWLWGTEIGPVDDVPGTAARIMYAMRLVGS